MGYTTAQLLTSIKRAVTVPSNQYRFTDADMLSIADEETEAVILPMLDGIRQEFMVKTVDVDIVADQDLYKIPYRAVGRKLRWLKLYTEDETFIRNLAYVTPEDSHMYLPTNSGDPRGFTVQGEYVKLLPNPAHSTDFLKMAYMLQPGFLVEASEAGIITSIDRMTGDITIGAAVTAFTSGAQMDFIDGKTGNGNKAEDVVNTNVAANVITFDPADIPDDLVEGDYIALSQETPVVQLPKELVQSLVQATVNRILEAQGDFEGLQAGVAKLGVKLSAAEKLLTPRVEGNLPVVINRNGLLTQRRSLIGRGR